MHGTNGLIGLLGGMLAVAACQPVLPDRCNAAPLQSLIGQDRSILAAMTFPAATRIVEPRSRITQDLVPTRLNILIGPTGLIENVSCG